MAIRPTSTATEGFNLSRSPYMDGSGGTLPPSLSYGMNFRDWGSYGLRQWSGWIREEFLPQLVGREAARVYREMADNSAMAGAMLFAIMQAMRRVEWKVEAPGDSDKSTAEVKFVESLMDDMTHTWADFVAEALSMLPYGYAINEIVYKRRLGPEPGGNRAFDPSTAKFAPPIAPEDEQPPSKFSDGRIGWHRLPIRGQETILKWFFDNNGQVTGVTQQPWVGQLLDIPAEKFLLFRPTAHKNNPEGRSVLRNAYRSYWFVKRLEELEAIMFERMSGFPVMSVPNSLLEAANSQNPAAIASLNYYKNLVTNVRINEQMGALIPSDVYVDAEGKPTNARMYNFELLTPQHGSRSISGNEMIERHKLDMLMTLLCDFIKLGHEVRGTNNLAVTRVDMFYAAIEGWLGAIADVLNRYAIPRVWKINALPPETMPQYKPDMPDRIDLDGLGGFMANLAKAGMPLFPDEELQEYIRGAAGLPEATSPEATAALAQANAAGNGDDAVKRMIRAAVAKKIIEGRRAA
jgi:hypothetical protein